MTKQVVCGKVKSMKFKVRIILVAFFSIFVLPSISGAYWIWTPQNGRWVNPKYTVKETPPAQLGVVKEVFEKKDFQSALKEAQKLIRYYPGSTEAAEAQFYIAMCLENLNKLYEAYQAFQKVIDKYPFSQRTDEIVEREFKIGDRLLDAEKRKVLGIDISYETVSLEIFNKVIGNSPYSKYAAMAQYKIGLILKGLKSYIEAKEAFQKVVDNYPKSEWVEPARFQIATCGSLASLKADYDQTQTEESKKEFQNFAKDHPDMEVELSKNVQDKLIQLNEKEAEANLKIAQFYERQKIFESAKIYYQYILDNYANTASAAKAAARLQVLERR